MKKRIKQTIRKSALINSFKLDKRFWQVLLLNTIFIILAIALISSYTSILRSNMDKMRPLNASASRIQDMMEGNLQPDAPLTEDLSLLSSALHFFFVNMTIISILSFIILIALVGYFKTIIWSKITREKFNKYTILKLSLLLLSWNIFWILIFLLTFFGLKFGVDTLRIITIIELFIYVYFTLMLIPIFFRNKEIFKSIKKTFSIGTLKIYALLPSILMMFVTLIIILSLVINLAYIIHPRLTILEIPLLLLYIVWIKFYMNIVIDRVYPLG